MTTTTSKPTGHQTKPPTPVADEHLAEEVRRLSGYTAQMLAEIKGINDQLARTRKQLVTKISWGVFIGVFIGFAVVWMLLFTIGMLGLGLFV